MAAISSNTQRLTVDQLERALESSASAFVERLNQRLGSLFASLLKEEEGGDIVLMPQMPQCFAMENPDEEEEVEEEVEEEEEEAVQLEAPLQNGGDAFRSKNGKSRSLEEIGQAIEGETFVQVLKQPSGKTSGAYGTFTRNGLLQLFFKEGFPIFLIEACPFNLQFQRENQVIVKVKVKKKKKGRMRYKKVRKKA